MWFFTLLPGQEDVVQRALETSCSQPQLDVARSQDGAATVVGGVTPWIYSTAQRPSQQVVEALIAAGADLSVQNLENQTAADLAKTETLGAPDHLQSPQEEIRAAVKKGEAQAESLLRTIMAMAKKDESTAAASMKALQSMGVPAELLALAGDDLPRFSAESPY
eukprot:Skav233236  [mRNA]  locus=scaffold2149:73012:75503:- [translate_table: standard]